MNIENLLKKEDFSSLIKDKYFSYYIGIFLEDNKRKLRYFDENLKEICL